MSLIDKIDRTQKHRTPRKNLQKVKKVQKLKYSLTSMVGGIIEKLSTS